MRRKKIVVGLDEVGRGALCGPVMVAAFAFLRGSTFPRRVEGVPLRDSKRLTPRARENWFRAVKAGARAGHVVFTTARVAPHIVDRINIRNATNLAATRAYERLVVSAGFSSASLTVLLDGGLLIRPRERFMPHAAHTIVRGDEKVPEIQLASIAAKVTRDRTMTRLHERYPAYGLAVHKGYGTYRHRKALSHHGPAKGLHRLTFVKKFSKVRAV